MSKYLDPKADITFKRVFGENPKLVISLLNALLPFDSPEEEIEQIEYLPPEQLPLTELGKDSIVDVRCRDAAGRTFLVEMQMLWSNEFMSRVMFNSSKAYVTQIKAGDTYDKLVPVYSLNLVNEVFEPDLPEYYHYYSMVNTLHPERQIKGLHLVFVELPKFRPQTFGEKRMRALWLRFLTEINADTTHAPEELLTDASTNEALSIVETAAYNEAQMMGYDMFWDKVSRERTRERAIKMAEARAEEAEAKAEEAEAKAEEAEAKAAIAHAEGLAKGEAKGRAEERAAIARSLAAAGMSPQQISQLLRFDYADLQ